MARGQAAKAQVILLEEQCGFGGDDPLSLDPAPGAEDSLLAKLRQLQSRSQAIIAKEEAEHATAMASLEAHVAELQARAAKATKQHQAQLASNDAFHAALQAKVSSLQPTPLPGRWRLSSSRKQDY